VSGNWEALFATTQFGNLASSVVMIVPSGGGEPLALTDAGTTNGSPVWMPDSKSILFVSNRGGGRDVYRQQLSDAGKPTAEPVRLTTGLNALSIDLSGDGEQLAYMMYLTKSNLWSIPIPESGPITVSSAIPLTTGSQNIEGVNVSRDGQWLAFDSNISGNQDVYRMFRGTRHQDQLTTDPSDDFQPAWSLDGKQIAFHSFRNGNRDIFVMSADGTHQQQVTNDPSQERYPDWSPDGKSLVFFSDKAGHYEIYVASNKNGKWGQPRQLTRTQSGATMPRWSPDGTQISYIDWFEGLTLMSRDGTNVRRLVLMRPEFKPIFAVWSHDSGTIYFRALDQNSVGSLWSVPATGGAPKRLVDFTEPDRMEFATDSKQFFFPITEREGDIWVLKFAR
jgi:Tol biopolymer transport system component